MPGYSDPYDDEYGEYEEDYINQQQAKKYIEELYYILTKYSSKRTSVSALKSFKSTERWSETITYNTDMYDKNHGVNGVVLNLVTGKFEKKK